MIFGNGVSDLLTDVLHTYQQPRLKSMLNGMHFNMKFVKLEWLRSKKIKLSVQLSSIQKTYFQTHMLINIDIKMTFLRG